MKNRKKYASLLLALVMCLSLAACGGAPADDGETDAPSCFEGLVKDSMLLPDEAVYGGAWTGDGGTLIVENSESGDEVRFALYDADDVVTASGFIQSVPEYGADYFYNEHDGWAYRSRLDGNDTLEIDSLGVFTKVSGDVPGENIGDTGYEGLSGVWYQDGEANAASIIEITASGEWTLRERSGDGEAVAVDGGSIERNPDGEGRYDAVSTMFDDVVYDMTVIDDSTMYWGGENDCYLRMA